MKWALVKNAMAAVLFCVLFGCAVARAQPANPAAKALENEKSAPPASDAIANVIREANNGKPVAPSDASGRGLELGVPGASPMAAKKCLRLDPETGFGPDVISNFNFPDADIVEIAETLGRITCLNFIFDKDVKGRISIVNNSKITVGDAWKAFLTALDMSGFSIIPSGQFLRIARQRDAKDKQIKTYAGEYSPNTDEFITRILPLKYIDAQDVANMLRNFMPPNSRVLAYEKTNTLIITDTGANVRKIADMIEHLDVARFDERITVLPLSYASASDVAKMVQEIILSGGPGGAPGGISGVGRISGLALSGVSKTRAGAQISHVLADDRTNSIIVAANAEGTAQVRELVQKLDYRVPNNPNGSRVRVIYLQYADAEQLAQTMNSMISGAMQRPNAGAPGGTPNAPATTAVAFEGTVKVSADKPTNALLITGTQADFVTMNQVVAKLDVPRDQVYVEAVIMEMTVNKEFDLGVSVANPSSGVGFLPNTDLATSLQNPLALSGLILGFQAGASATVSIPGTNQTINIKSVQGLIRALQQHTNSDILATPQLLTLDNQEASIEIAENIPVPVSTAIQGAGVATSISREKVALSLKIKPQINKASDFVKLDIDQKLEDIENRTLPAAVQSLAFATTSRSSKTTVVVQNGDTVALGGLVRNTLVEATTKVPILGDIPLLGWLFRARTTTALKQNLLAFITPRVIKQYRNIRSILDQKIRQRDDFLEENRGGVDPFLEDKRQMIQSLPPVADLKENGRVENRQPAGALVAPQERPSTDESLAPGLQPSSVVVPSQ